MKLIDKDAAIELLRLMQEMAKDAGVKKGIGLAWEQIKALPTIEVVDTHTNPEDGYREGERR